MKNEKLEFSNYLTKDIIPVSIAGVVDRLVLHPFDTIATTQQLHNIHFSTAVRKIMNGDGIRGYYRGMLAPLISAAPVRISTYSSYFIAHDILGKEFPKNPLLAIALAGMISGFTETTLVCPSECYRTMKTHQQAVNFSPRKLFRGYTPLLFRTMIENTIAIAGSDLLKQALQEDVKNDVLSTYVTGTISGAASQFIITPIDLVKTKVMTDNHRSSLSAHIRNVWLEGGIFKSAPSKMLRMGIGNGLILGTTSILRRLIHDDPALTHESLKNV